MTTRVKIVHFRRCALVLLYDRNNGVRASFVITDKGEVL